VYHIAKSYPIRLSRATARVIQFSDLRLFADYSPL
jgi:hypothetical protein